MEPLANTIDTCSDDNRWYGDGGDGGYENPNIKFWLAGCVGLHSEGGCYSTGDTNADYHNRVRINYGIHEYATITFNGDAQWFEDDKDTPCIEYGSVI